MSHVSPPTCPSIPTKIDELIGQMTIEEKANFLSHHFIGIPRLGLRPIHWGMETVHGVGRIGKATVYPSALSLASTFDPDLVQQVAEAIGDEAMALYHWQESPTGHWLGVGRLTWSPVINLYRDPRWGRGQETYGEDPYLTTTMALAYIKGMAGNNPERPRIGCMVKHFAAHSGPERDRHRMNIGVSLKDLHESYLPAFKETLTQGGAVGVMGAYTRLNGEHCCASPWLLKKLLRDEWGFKGLVISDGGALADLHGESELHGNHGLTRDSVESAAYALRRGCQICLGPTYQHLPAAVERGLVQKDEVDQVVREVLEFAFHHKLFEWNPKEALKYPISLVSSTEHRALARSAARDSMVLLKNDHVLPLSKNIRKITVVGPYAASITPLLGNYHGFSSNLVSPLEGIVGKLAPTVKITYEPACDPRAETIPVKWWTTHKPKGSDFVIAVFGVDPQSEGEEYDAPYSENAGDRLHLGLPPAQQEYLETIAEHGCPIILVLVSAGPLTLPGLFEHPNIKSVIHMGYSGEEGGNALADLLFGDANFSGRLPVTWPRSVEDLPPFEDYSMKNRGYRYSNKTPLVPFGFGLSYTTFRYEWIEQPVHESKCGEPFKLTVKITNTGTHAGGESVQTYLSGPGAGTLRPQKELVALSKIFLRPGEFSEITLVLPPERFDRIDEQGHRISEPGTFTVTIGGSQGDPLSVCLGANPVLTTQLQTF